MTTTRPTTTETDLDPDGAETFAFVETEYVQHRRIVSIRLDHAQATAMHDLMDADDHAGLHRLLDAHRHGAEVTETCTPTDLRDRDPKRALTLANIWVCDDGSRDLLWTG